MLQGRIGDVLISRAMGSVPQLPLAPLSYHVGVAVRATDPDHLQVHAGVRQKVLDGAAPLRLLSLPRFGGQVDYAACLSDALVGPRSRQRRLVPGIGRQQL